MATNRATPKSLFHFPANQQATMNTTNCKMATCNSCLPNRTLPVLMTIWYKEDTEMEHAKGKRFASIRDAVVRLKQLLAYDELFAALIEHDALGTVYSLHGDETTDMNTTNSKMATTIQRAWRDFAKSKHHCSACGDYSKGVLDSLDPYGDIDWYCQSCWDEYAMKDYYCPFCCDSKHTVVSTYREMCQECCQECS